MTADYVELSEACRFYDNGSSETLVWFAGLHEPFLGRRILDETNINGLYLVDAGLNWYTNGVAGLGGSFEQSVEQLRGFMDEHPATYTFCGQSSGGYAALRFSHALSPALCIAFAPQTRNLNDRPSVHLPALGPLYAVEPRRFPIIFHLSRSERNNQDGRWDDWKQIEDFMQSDQVTVVRHPFDVHAVSLPLYGRRQFLETMVSNMRLYARPVEAIEQTHHTQPPESGSSILHVETVPEAAPLMTDPTTYRAEFNTRDQRNARFTGPDFEIVFTDNASYPTTDMTIMRSDGRHFHKSCLASHLGFGKFMTSYQFTTVLDVGSRDGMIARAMEFLGKEVETVEILPKYEAVYSCDYLDLAVAKQVDAIWCSHVYDQQRYPGNFLDKIFDDLRPGGVLALTVPTAIQPLLIGHHNILTSMLLIYQLISAGFDCSGAMLKQYDQQMTLIVRKVSNGVPRISFASTMMGSKGDLGQVEDLIRFFPRAVQPMISRDGVAWGEIEEIAWNDSHAL